METLHELTSEMKEIADEIEYLIALDIDTEHLEETMESLKKKVMRKVQNIDHVAIGFDIAKKRLELVANAYEQEAAIAKKKAEQMEKHKERIYQMLADTELVTREKPLKTGQHTYYIGTTNGSVVISDDAQLPPEYLKTKIEQVIDKSQLRLDLMHGKQIPGVTLDRKERVMRR